MTNFTASDLQDLCDRLRPEYDVMGAQIAIAQGEQVVQASSGVANAELGLPVTEHTVFQIGSTTKVYTAVLVMQLVDAGLIDLDTPVTEYLPDARLAAGEEWRRITPRHLMSMTSGLDNGPYAHTSRNDDSVAEYVSFIGDIPLTFPPGTAYGYSNASTTVSGLLVERMTGQSWDDALRDRLLRPAALTESVSLFEELAYHPVAVGHTPEMVRPWSQYRGSGPDGGTLATSARDLARFGQIFLRSGKAADGTTLLSEQAVATMQTPQVSVPSKVFADSWCVGPYQKIWDGIEIFGHSGTTEHGSSTLLWVPELDVSVATVVNTAHRGYPFADAAFSTVFRDWLGVAKPARPVGDPTLTVDASLYVGEYEQHDTSYVVGTDDTGLFLEANHSGEILRTALAPIAEHRFLPTDDSITGNHAWDIAFALGADGRSTLLHNGAFAARRV
ncbi:serine hydrolase domain-containing protein [Arthrobacter sp. B2a2-09]|uniref:serine hydrolase domain-containing protein n=1 Tax=Arthrobacter sp. B2a2-09 TaxID=2952822 RepID=UPI0022CD3C0F|nr:serine hydrolase domain-containing protein [Arthrobacter sp. B2a2-09]MCZ9880455.1 beta-lactamase family protein [Arthrobacter sp. B2a2-09]